MTFKMKRCVWIIFPVIICIALLCGFILPWNTVKFKLTVLEKTKMFDADSTKNLHQCLFSLRIFVIVLDRTKSMLRLLDSLNRANYGKDKIKIEIWIDSYKDGRISNETYAAALKFDFKYGTKEVILHNRHVGLYGQWLTTYKPKINCSEIAVILEDDLIVSPHFYTYLKMVHRKYSSVTEINGFSLQGVEVKFSPGSSGYIEGPKDETVYLYPVLGSWGFSPKSNNWAKFLNWFDIVCRNDSFHPYIPNHIATDWYKQHEISGKADTMWEIWHIYYAWIHKEFTLYSNFPNHVGLTANWVEKGLHYTGTGSETPSNHLLQNWNLTYEKLPDKPAKLDIAGNIITCLKVNCQ